MEFSLRTMPNDFKIKRHYLDRHAGTLEVLFLGNSHSYYNLNPIYFKNAYNAGNVSQPVDYDYRILERYIERMPALKTVVIPVSYFSLVETLQDFPEEWRLKNYTIYYDMPEYGKYRYNSEVLSVPVRQNLKRIYNFYIKKESPVTTSVLGWGIDFDSVGNESPEATGVYAAKNHTAKNFSKISYTLSYYEKIIKLCAERNIKVVLFTAPAVASYYNNIDKRQWYVTQNNIRKLVDGYLNCSYYDFLESKEFTSHDFFDSHHLNHQGAKKFSLMLNEILNKL